MPITTHFPDLERLFTESTDDLTRYFARRNGVGDLVRDLVQETFLQMTAAVKAGRTFQCARGYLFGIARHVSQAAWSEGSKNAVVPFDSATHQIAAPLPDERIAAARETIRALSSLQREILDLRFSQGLSYAEIAEALGIPVGTVRSRLHNAIAEVKNRLETENILTTQNL